MSTLRWSAWLLALVTFVFGAGFSVGAVGGAQPSGSHTALPHRTTATAPRTVTDTTVTGTTVTGTTEASTSRATKRTTPVPTTAGPPTTDIPPFRSRIDRVTAADLGASYHDGCPVGPAELRQLTVSYVGFDGTTHTGRLVVAAAWARQLAGVFATLYAERFPIRGMQPVTAFGASDDASMAADNSSAFNCRAITGGSSFSEHSYGTAVDLNPVENPYLSGSLVEPAAGAGYLDRADLRPGMISRDGQVVAAFAAIGWSWGGGWSSPTDYQHFSASGR